MVGREGKGGEERRGEEGCKRVKWEEGRGREEG
jgi:hypothetical protein